MSSEDLTNRLAYFETKLAEAQQKVAAKEAYLPKFSAGFTTEKLNTWQEVVAVIQDRIATIEAQRSSALA